jgi:hypothetical protein
MDRPHYIFRFVENVVVVCGCAWTEEKKILSYYIPYCTILYFLQYFTIHEVAGHGARQEGTIP